jgi:uncharacterized membrane protein YoaK (UPF0700 family)
VYIVIREVWQSTLIRNASHLTRNQIVAVFLQQRYSKIEFSLLVVMRAQPAPKMESNVRRFLFLELLSFNGGFVDTVGFIGLQGLFTAHVTGNFVTLGAALVFGSKGVVAKLIALPEFIAVVAIARLVGARLTARGLPTLRILLAVKVLLLLAFFVLAVALGPFADSDDPRALLTGFAAIAAMAVQNAAQRVHLGSLPPTTLMTGNTTQVTLDAIDLLTGAGGDQRAAIRARFSRMLAGIAGFAAGCAIAALLYAWIGFWCVAVSVAIGTLTAIMRDAAPPKAAA